MKSCRIVGFVNAVQLRSSLMEIVLRLVGGLRRAVYAGDRQTFEEVKDTVGGVEVVVDDVHQIPIFHHAVDELAAGASRAVTLGPVGSEAVCFVFPREEADRFDDGGLHDFFAWKDAPCYGVWAVAGRVGSEVTLLVDGVEGHVGVLVYAMDELSD